MFQNPNTLWIEILVLVLAVGFVAAMIGVHFYRKAHHLPTGDCAMCHGGKSRLLKDYEKKYGKIQ